MTSQEPIKTMSGRKAVQLSFKQLIAKQDGPASASEGLVVLLEHVEKACRAVAKFAGQGAVDRALDRAAKPRLGINVHGEEQRPLDVLANDTMIGRCMESGQLCGVVSEEMAEPARIPDGRRRGRYLLVIDPLDGSSNIDVDMTVGTIFSILRAPTGLGEPELADFLQPGTAQVAAGYALYGPATMLVLTLGAGVNGFTLDRDGGSFILTHPDMRIPPTTREFAINASNRRFWEPPVRQYVDECLEGAAGPRGADFNMRWIASLVAEVHRILIRGGIFMYPRDTRDPAKPGRLRLTYEANPMAMIVEQAGGLASTGRQRILDIVPQGLHQRVPLILGARHEVERLVRYHEVHDRGEDIVFETPLFHSRSLFRSV
jgi:fructose-1,6-bisphosphatase I